MIMVNNKKFLIRGIICLFTFITIDLLLLVNISNKCSGNKLINEYCFSQENKKWNNLIESIIYVESNGKDDAIGTCNSVGCLQLTPIYVRECNKILGQEHYTLNDRFDREKSIEMFNVYQFSKNPNFDIDKAIKLHNPRAFKIYKNKILNHLKFLQKHD